MSPTKFYRFELAFENKPLHKGMCAGLSCTDLSSEAIDALSRPFQMLTSPQLNDPEARFWFTAKGVNTFLPDIENIYNAISALHYQLIVAQLPELPAIAKYIVYEDEYQAVICVSSFNTGYLQFDAKWRQNL